MPSGRSAYKNTNALRFLKYTPREAVVPHVAALSPLSSSGSKSDDRRDDRPAASSPEPADTSRRLWPHPGRVRSTQAAILTTDRLAATTAAATAAQRREPRSRDFASSLLPFNESAAKRRRKGPVPRRAIRRAAVRDVGSLLLI